MSASRVRRPNGNKDIVRPATICTRRQCFSAALPECGRFRSALDELAKRIPRQRNGTRQKPERQTRPVSDAGEGDVVAERGERIDEGSRSFGRSPEKRRQVGQTVAAPHVTPLLH